MAQIQGGYLIEGYTEETISKVDKHLIELRTALQNKIIKQAEIVGIEEFPLPSKKGGSPKLAHCAVLDYNGITGYVQLEDMDKKVMTIDKLRSRVGTKVIFMVTKLVKEKENDEPFFVASRKLAQELAAKTTLEIRSEGEVSKAAITHVGLKHVVVDLGGIESNIHVSELSHGWIENLHDKFKIGDVIDVKILNIDKEKETIKVSHKATLPSLWDTIEKKFKINSEHKCKISGVTEAGNFVNLAEGVDAFAPHLRHEYLNVGDEVLVRIIELNPAKKKAVCRIVRTLHR